jgi:hypothetical protein
VTTAATTFVPSERPRFGLAARSLVLTLQQQPRIEDRAAKLVEVGRDLGDDWFSFYIKLLMVIGEGAPQHDRVLVADAIAHGLQHGQAAAGTLSGWREVNDEPGMACEPRDLMLMHAGAPLQAVRRGPGALEHADRLGPGGVAAGGLERSASLAARRMGSDSVGRALACGERALPMESRHPLVKSVM